MILGITLGDPHGVGPDILLRSWHEIPANHVVYGDRVALQRCAEAMGIVPAMTLIDHPSEARAGRLNVIDCGAMADADLHPGTESAASGGASVAYLDRAIAAARDGQVAAIVTLPINKEAARLRIPGFAGHTEHLAQACGRTRYAMMLIDDRCAVTHVSTHVSLAEAVRLVRRERVLEVIRLTQEALCGLHRRPRIAVAGLNPHAGEHGTFGNEDDGEILPAIHDAQALGIDATGPVPPDTVFMHAFSKRFDAVVAMYHDQGHIPMKSGGIVSTVNVTIGLPLIRTSVDHGTAFDIAWQGKADTANFLNACRQAVRLASAN